MAEVAQTEVVLTEQQGTQVPGETSPSEVKARELGWKPLEEYNGPEDKWVDADEFVSRQPLFEKIDSLKSELWKNKQEFQKEFSQIKHHFEEMKEVEFKRALTFLKTQKIEALESGDNTAVLEIDDKIDSLKDQRAAEKVNNVVSVQKGPDPEFVVWAEKNTWYAQDSDLREDADAFAMAFVNKNPGIATKQILDHVDKKMKQLHPDNFGGTMRQQSAPSVEAGTNNTNANRGKQKLTIHDLSPDEKSIMKTLVERKVLTQEKYLEDLAKAKGLSV